MRSTTMMHAVATLFVFGDVAIAGAQVAQPEMVATWKGQAQIFVNWTKAKALTVSLAIDANDHVTGTIGDATLVDGRFIANRGWLGRMFHVKTDYRIVGTLQGPVIAAEGITRASVSLPLTWREGWFVGSVITSGSAFGGAESMVLAAGKLVLERAPKSVAQYRSW